MSDAEELQRWPRGSGAVKLKLGEGAKRVAIVELRCETELVAKGKEFQELLETIAEVVLGSTTEEDAAARAIELISSGRGRLPGLREDVVLARAQLRVLDGDGKIGVYTHHDGKVGAAIGVNASSEACGEDAFDVLLKDLAMHAAAHVPHAVAVDRASLPEDLVAREERIAREAIEQHRRLSGKPEEVKQELVEAKLLRFFTEWALLEQTFVKDPRRKVGDVLREYAKALGGEVRVAWFTRQAID